MKKLLQSSLLAIFCFFLLQTTAFAQNNTKVGVGVAYEGELETAGLQVNAVFPVTERFAVAPNITYYFTDEEDAPYWDNYLALNLDGHFLIETAPNFNVYALGGLNLTSIDYYDNPNTDIDDDSDTELGLNLGLGGEYHLEEFSLFGDLKYVISDFDRVVLAIGARIPI